MHRQDNWWRRWLPHPLLSAILFLLWLALVNYLDTATLMIGGVLSLVIPLITRSIWTHSPKLYRGVGVIGYLLIVLWDVVVANVQVAWLIVFRPGSSLRSRWLTVPLDLTSDEAISILAATITLTPGTVSCDLSADRRALLVHGLDVTDEARAVAWVKSRYEARLKEIFR